jgi:hypothetical protein
MLDADWYNIGICGAGNYESLKFLCDVLMGHHFPYFLSPTGYKSIKADSWPNTLVDFVAHLDPALEKEMKQVHCVATHKTHIDIKNYSKVYVFVTLTETGRDISYYKLFEDTPRSVVEYLKQEEEKTYDLISYLKKESKIQIIVGRNFTVDFPTTRNSQCNVDMPWTEINYRYNAKNGFNNLNISLDDILCHGPVSEVAFNLLNESSEQFDDYKKFFIQQVDKVTNCWQWLTNNPLNVESSHPTKESHKLWAEYLISKV